LSLRRQPELEDATLLKKWTQELNFEEENIVFAAEKLKKGNMEKLDAFLLELYSMKSFSKEEIEEFSKNKQRTYDLAIKINKALSIYYFDVKKSYHDALLCYDVIDGKEYWNIVLLDDPTALHNGLKNVSVIYRFVCDADPANKAVKEKALYNYARRRLRRYSLGILDCSGVQPSQTTSFNITSVPVPGFVSFLEFKVKPRAQIIYSPFQDGFIQYKFVSVKSTYDEGHLYLSFLPYKFVREGGKLQDPDGQMLVRMSDELVRPQDMSAARMYLRNDEVTYRGINVKLNK
jgi:hypothetical protein